MHKYFAVIVDSFREAMVSRVLWLLVGLSTLLLIALVPLGYREDVTWKLGDSDVRDWLAFLDHIRKEGPKEKPSPARRIWTLFDEDLRKRLTAARIPGKDQEQANPFEFMGTLNRFQKDINRLIERPDFYDAECWKGVTFLSAELNQLHQEKPEARTSKEQSRYHRLLLETAFPEMIRGSPPTSIQLVYGWHDLGPPQPLRSTTLQDGIRGSVIWILKWLVGAVGVLIAILVTAPIIPQMFDPGSLHLLLSKPISRSLLFLSKYVGGCSFILIGATYLIGGLWLILGLRFGIWDSRLLVSIPIYLFVFAVYYSVSALTGAVWRSPIAAVFMTILFFVSCWVIGTTKVSYERLIWNKERIVRLLPLQDALLAVNELGVVHEWDGKKKSWKEVFVSETQKHSRGLMLIMPVVPREFRPVGPVYDAAHDRLLSAQPSFPPGKTQLCVGPRQAGWESTSGASAPMGIIELLADPGGAPLAVTNFDLQRLTGDPLSSAEPWTVWGVTIPLPAQGVFESVAPDPPVIITQPAAVALNSDTRELAVYTRGTLTILRRGTQDRYERRCDKAFKDTERQPVVLGFAGSTLLLGRQDGRLQVLDAEKLNVKAEFRPAGSTPPRLIAASPGGRWFASVFHHGHVWLYDSREDALTKPAISGQGDVSCAGFTGESQLLIADRQTRVSRYRLPDLHVEHRHAPSLGFLDAAYCRGLLPLYTVFPKPGELDKTFDYLLSGKETKAEVSEDLSASQQVVHPWTPLWSSALFLVALLLITCVYMERQDF